MTCEINKLKGVNIMTENTLQKAVSKAFGEESEVLMNDEKAVLINMKKGDSYEYVALSHNFESLFWGKYYPYDEKDEEAKKDAFLRACNSYYDKAE